jgi:predicted nucleic-acid-binding protein
MRREADYPNCETLLFEKLIELRIYMPLQILVELQRNLRNDEMRGVLRALSKAKSIIWDYAPASLELISKWRERGAKKGDAIIAAHLQAAAVKYFISENRHLLIELRELPFEVLTSKQAVDLLE